MKDNLVSFPEKKLNPIEAVQFLIEDGVFPVPQAIIAVMTQITKEKSDVMNYEHFGRLWLLLYQAYLQEK